MTQLPTVELFAAPVADGATPRVTVRCYYCGQLHSHRWFGFDQTFTATAPCSPPGALRQYRVDLRAADRDDNAMHQPVPNWEE